MHQHRLFLEDAVASWLQVLTRPFNLAGDSSERKQELFLPLADLLSHARDANAQDVVRDGVNYVMAMRRIAKGQVGMRQLRARCFRLHSLPSATILWQTCVQAILHDYRGELMHRPDGSLFFHGVVEPQQRPLLCTVDLPQGYSVFSGSDTLYDGR